MKTTFNSVLFILLFVPTVILAQTTISGTVTEQSTSTPLPGVNVIIKGTTTGTSTDFDGKYQLTVNNGERIVTTNLDIGSFQIGSYSVFGMESSTDPPAINSGKFVLEFMSGDPTQNELALFPFYLAGGVGVIVAIVLVTKKRN